MKNLVSLNGKPLLYYTIMASLQSGMVDRTIVSTDNKRIMKKAKKMGAEVITRPKKLSGDKIAIEPTILQVLDHLKQNEGYIPDLILLLQNTSPLRTSKHIDDAIKLFKKGKFDSILSGYVSHSLFWKANKKFVSPLNYNPRKRPNRQQMNNQFIENGAIYLTKHSLFRKSKCRVSGKIGMYIMPEYYSIQIDTKYDISFAGQIVRMVSDN